MHKHEFSHAKILGTSNSGRRNDLNGISYMVEHKDVFKMPTKVKMLPVEINTALADTACGVKLKIGAEYLLAGGWFGLLF
ncbi:hypothetical protein NECAME_01063 [Necator americanus]|uniref:Uncharacterized protein n=1 Tax=Necator americanus TaxID=51031 RepID=W2SKH4_NECAM|nr:hypothetical protein NECAME_01063 [Necator americanus]ETN70115.1 hypothetical protein NECAME_01063 [Necator americanus]